MRNEHPKKVRLFSTVKLCMCVCVFVEHWGEYHGLSYANPPYTRANPLRNLPTFSPCLENRAYVIVI